MSATATQLAPLTVERARQLVIEVVEEFGADYVYPHPISCTYLKYDDHDNPTEPACLIGHILVRHGVPMHVLAQHEGRSAGQLLDKLVEAQILKYEPRVKQAARRGQMAQDSGNDWGFARDVFLHELGE